MSNESVKENLKYLDRRVVDRYIKDGLLSRKDLESHIGRLSDDAAKADWVTYDLEETELTEASVSGNGSADNHS
ncbi:MAG: hypothetical protein KDD51_03255 [Bdellovibrionales bacterium]|nr:hypothetical protein [Bdellovibrionales bacterium]